MYVELQADCFAGAGPSTSPRVTALPLRLSDDDLDHALAGFLELRDPSGVDGGDAGAHGNAGFDAWRVPRGFEKGARVCHDYTTNPPEVT